MENKSYKFLQRGGGKSNVLFTLLLSILFLMPTLGAKAQTNEPYVVLKDGTATFYYNSSKPNGALPIQSKGDDANWPEDTRNSVTKVVFDASFKDYEPTSCAYWFYKFENLTEISGIKENLNTANVTDMRGMFYNCSSLTPLDVSNFNTENVKDMRAMFSHCSSLTTLDVSNFNTANVTDMGLLFSDCRSLTTLDVTNFNTANVTDMSSMFSDCRSLTTLDVSNFNTANVTSMYRMFYWCSSLTTLDVSNFNTANVTDMDGMFKGCIGLTTLDVSNFNTANVTDMNSMFFGCSSLNVIFVGDNWSTASVTKSSGMFAVCTKLYGGKGSAYNANITDATYAKIDGGVENPGYFTKSGEPAFDPHKPYAIVKDGVVTFYSGISVPDGALPMRTEMDDKNWTSDIRKSITKVVFDESFKNYEPNKTSYWFLGCENLTEISGMKYINTDKLEYMNEMFQFCDNLKSVDLSGFTTEKVTDKTRMFWGCNNLEYVIVGNGWNTSALKKSSGMFEDCFKLHGGKGTAYNADFTDATYARIDGGAETPGYLTKSGEPLFKKSVVSIEITTTPQTEYNEGDDFVADNGKLTVKYNDNTTEIIDLSAATITGYDKTKPGEQTLKIKYEGVTIYLTITIKAKEQKPDNPNTPVSSISAQEDINVWCYNHTIFIENAPDTEYKIIDTNGRVITTSTTKSSKEEIKINKSGVLIVLIGNTAYKVVN